MENVLIWEVNSDDEYYYTLPLNNLLVCIFLTGQSFIVPVCTSASQTASLFEGYNPFIRNPKQARGNAEGREKITFPVLLRTCGEKNKTT